MRYTFALLLCFLFLAVPLTAQEELPYFEPSDCPFGEIDADVECGYLFVPEDRNDPDSPAIALAVALLNSPDPIYPPIINLEGGPGGASLVAVEAWLESALLAERNIVLIDQRGTGYSEPSLNCFEVDEGEETATEDCRERLISEGINLNAYDSAQNAADIADLITALELGEASLYGSSYGTRLALTIMRDYPDNLASVIIDAVYPPHVQGYNEQPLWSYRAFRELFDACAAQPACDAAYPDLEQVFYDTVNAMNAEPMVFVDEETGEEFEMTGDDLVNDIFSQLYDVDAIPTLPQQIYDYMGGGEGGAGLEDAAAGLGGIDLSALSDEEYEALLMEYLEFESVDDLYDFLDSLTDDEYFELEDELIAYLSGDETFAGDEEQEDSGEEAFTGYVLDPSLLEIDSDSEGLFNSIECQEEVYFNTLEEAEALAADIPEEIRLAMIDGVIAQFNDCDLWQVELSPEIENEPVESDIPTLVLSGQFDPITPPEWGQAAADYLPNSFHFVFPGMGHGTVDLHPCPTDIALAFLADPFTEPDSSCIAEMSGPDFVTP
ncbi:MAG: hypothetical protein OHK0046_28990 [Anaerolineae bacterium]